jgi:hypothetical protein
MEVITLPKPFDPPVYPVAIRSVGAAPELPIICSVELGPPVPIPKRLLELSQNRLALVYGAAPAPPPIITPPDARAALDAQPEDDAK